MFLFLSRQVFFFNSLRFNGNLMALLTQKLGLLKLTLNIRFACLFAFVALFNTSTQYSVFFRCVVRFVPTLSLFQKNKNSNYCLVGRSDFKLIKIHSGKCSLWFKN